MKVGGGLRGDRFPSGVSQSCQKVGRFNYEGGLVRRAPAGLRREEGGVRFQEQPVCWATCCRMVLLG